MNSLRANLSLVLLIATSGCTFTFSKPLTLQVELASDAQPNRMAGSTFVLKNTSTDHFVIVRDVQVEGQLPMIRQWIGPRLGRLKFHKTEEVWTHDARVEALTVGGPDFAEALLGPGESFGFEHTLRAGAEMAKARLAYYVLTQGEVRAYCFVEQARDPKDSLTQKFAHHRAKGKGPWTVLFDRRRLQDITRAWVDVNLRKPAKEPSPQGKYCAALGGWVTQEKDQTVLARPDGKKAILPDCDPLVIDLFDINPDKISFLLPPAKYSDLVPVAMGQPNPVGGRWPGTTLVSPKDLPSVLERARTLGQNLWVKTLNPYGLGADNHIVIGPWSDRYLWLESVPRFGEGDDSGLRLGIVVENDRVRTLGDFRATVVLHNRDKAAPARFRFLGTDPKTAPIAQVRIRRELEKRFAQSNWAAVEKFAVLAPGRSLWRTVDLSGVVSPEPGRYFVQFVRTDLGIRSPEVPLTVLPLAVSPGPRGD